MNNYLYPPSPADVKPGLLLPSLNFKKQVGKVITSIILFFIVYILLVLAAFALAIGCFYYGALLIITLPKFITLMIGLGIMALGVSVVFFLIKFIFAVSKNDNASRVEIHESEQPQLFEFIRTLSEETKTPFPKKIFITSDVNAAVFYNSSFWSMFLPVRKNLEIGLGLVNSINISEFKAVVAHEFGHFSQRSMKLGSFTYNVNQVIYNMLYNNTSYTAFLHTWGGVNGYMAFFANITIKIAQAIQWVLRRMYEFINKNYFGLSREMEFHADAVAATVAGGNNLVTALSRIELADSCYNSALHKAGGWVKEKKQSQNIFENQLTIFQSLANEYKLPIKDGLPQVSFQFIQSFSQSRINYKNQWASHPPLEERKLHLDKLGVDVQPDETSAWQVFSNYGQLQEQITENLYSIANIEDALEKFDGAYFEEQYNRERASTMLPSMYKGFYDKRFINVDDWDLDALRNNTPVKNFDTLFNDENGQLQSSITSNENDIAIVKSIRNKEIDVKTFDFDGIKQDVANCDVVIKQLEEEVNSQIEQQQLLDKQAFIFFYNKAGETKESLVNGYKHYQVMYKRYTEYEALANKVMEVITPFYQSQNGIETIKASVAGLKAVHEKNLKAFFSMLLQQNILSSADKTLVDQLANFIAKDYVYFALDSFHDTELNELSELTIKVADALTGQKLDCYKRLLEEQAGSEL